MQSQSAHRIMRRGFERGSDQARGVGRSALSFTSARALETSVPNLARTPAQLTTMLLQDGAGNFLAIPGYNAPPVAE